MAHHPLVLNRSGQKLSKRSGSIAIRERRFSGEIPQILLGQVAHHLGWIENFRPLDLPEITNIFVEDVEAAACV